MRYETAERHDGLRSLSLGHRPGWQIVEGGRRHAVVVPNGTVKRHDGLLGRDLVPTLWLLKYMTLNAS